MPLVLNSGLTYGVTNRKSKQPRSLSPVGICDRQGHLLILKLNPDISPYGNMALIVATFDPGRHPSACRGLCDALEDLSTAREVYSHDNA